MRIFTHVNPDLDALLSVVAVRRYIPAAASASVVFRPANWDGAEMEEGDIAVDMRAGGRGWKGEESGGVVHSCFAFVMIRNAPTADCKALSHLISYVDAQDSNGNAVKHFIPEASQETRDTLAYTSFSAVVSALKAAHKSDFPTLLLRLEEIFTGMLAIGRSRERAEEMANNAEFFAGGAVAFVRDMGPSVTYALYARGVRVVIFKNTYGMGIAREQRETLRMDHPKFRAVIEAAGEEVGDGDDKWYAHPSGFLFAWGTTKSPAKTPSRVNPYALVAVAEELLSQEAF